MKKNFFLLIIIISVSLFSCNKSETCFDILNVTEEIEDYCRTIDHVEINIVHPLYILPENFDETFFSCEEEIELNASYNIWLRQIPAEYVVALLLSAPEIDISNQKRKIPIYKDDNLLFVKECGIIIDIIEWNENETQRRFIMLNDGLNAFYEKGKEGVYYKMPEILLKNFTIDIHSVNKQLKQWKR